MIPYGAVVLGLAAGLAFGAAGAGAATPPAALDPLDSAPPSGTLDWAPQPDRPAVPTARERAPTGNPLWAVPLRTLSATRERPLFSPSRRPPPPAVVAAPHAPPPPVAKPAEPDHPLLQLVGTVVGESEAIGVFVDEATKNVLRLHTGDDHAGWVLRTVQGRDATFEKDRRKATLSLPAPGAEPTVPAILAGPAAAQAGNSWVDGDGQIIAPPPRRISQPAAPPPTAAAPPAPEGRRAD